MKDRKTKKFEFDFNGISFPVLISENESTISNSLKEKKVWEDYHLIHYKNLLGKDSTFIDIGANVGINSLYAYFLKNKGSNKINIISIEADEETFQLLEENTKNTEIDCLFYAVADEDGVIGFSGSNTHGHIKSNNPIGEEEVPSITMDSIIENFSIQSVDLVKIDVEGYTDVVLAKSKKFLEVTKSAIVEFSIMDIENRFGVDANATKEFDEIFKHFLSNSFLYKYYLSRNDGLISIDSVDELIAVLSIEHNVGDVLFRKELADSITLNTFLLRKTHELMVQNHQRIEAIDVLKEQNHQRIEEIDVLKEQNHQRIEEIRYLTIQQGKSKTIKRILNRIFMRGTNKDAST